MAIFRITTKLPYNVNGVHIEKGMSVEVISPSADPFTNPKTKDDLTKAFMAKYGIDLKKANVLGNRSLFFVEKIN